MVCPCKTATALAAQRRKRRTVRRKRTARQVSAYTLASGKPVGTAMAGRISAYGLDGSPLAANTYGPSYHAFSMSPYVPDIVTPTAVVPTGAVATTATAVAAQRRKRRRVVRKKRVVRRR